MSKTRLNLIISIIITSISACTCLTKPQTAVPYPVASVLKQAVIDGSNDVYLTLNKDGHLSSDFQLVSINKPLNLNTPNYKLYNGKKAIVSETILTLISNDKQVDGTEKIENILYSNNYYNANQTVIYHHCSYCGKDFRVENFYTKEKLTTMNISSTINLNHADSIPTDTIIEYYQLESLQTIITTTLDYMFACVKNGLSLPYFANLTSDLLNNDFDKQIELDIYITDLAEGRELNHHARGKDYATNILSYPCDLPSSVLAVLPSIPLGELVICQEMIERQAKEQGKTVNDHLTHLLVHGILHLLGFDHELGDAERIEMEAFEVEILKDLGVKNPY